jgi:hypothetical protein
MLVNYKKIATLGNNSDIKSDIYLPWNIITTGLGNQCKS